MLKTGLQGSATSLPCLRGLGSSIHAGPVTEIKAYTRAYNKHDYYQHVAGDAGQERIAFLPETCYNHTVKLYHYGID